MKIVPKVKSLTAYHRVADFATWPLMFALGKFRSDSIQETTHGIFKTSNQN